MFWGGQAVLCTFSELGEGLAVALLGDGPHRVFTSQAGVLSVLHAWLGGNEDVSALWSALRFLQRACSTLIRVISFFLRGGGVSPLRFLRLVSCCPVPTWELECVEPAPPRASLWACRMPGD